MSYRYGYGYFGFDYMPVAQKRAKAQKQIDKLRKKNKNIQPIEPFTDRKIAHSFWGQSWCNNMERYADYENRLPRGKSYLRHGCVCDLQISEGLVTAMVSGSSMYNVRITIDKLSEKRAALLQELLQGKISSQLELLQGKIPKDVRELVGNPDNGIIPFPKEIHMRCSCPDSASLCKHLAAVLYGIGRRLDTDPGVLFTLRGLDPLLLCANESDIDFTAEDSEESLSGNEDLSALFDIDLGGMDLDLGDGAQSVAAEGPEKTESTEEPKTSARAGRKATKKAAAEGKADSTAGTSGTRGKKKPVKNSSEAEEVSVAAPAKKSATRAGRKKAVVAEPAATVAVAQPAAESEPAKKPGTGTGRKKAVVAEPAATVAVAQPAAESEPVKKSETKKTGGKKVLVAKNSAASESESGAATASVKQTVTDTVSAPFDGKNPTAEGLRALCELSGHTPQEVSYLAGIGYATFKAWLAKEGRLTLMPASIAKIEKYQKKVLKNKK